MTGSGRLLAGLDIGNATTELVLAVPSGSGLEPVWHGQVPTAGRKGAEPSLRAAATLLAQAERELQRSCSLVALAELRPVDTRIVAVRRRSPAAAVVNAVRPGASTPAGTGTAAGRHVPLADVGASWAAGSGEVIVSVPPGTDFEDAAARISAAMSAGLAVVGVLVAEDDAVLVHNRLPRPLPVVDEVDTDGIPAGVRVAVEVVPVGSTRRVLADPLAVAAALELPPGTHHRVAAATREFADLPALALVAGDVDRVVPPPRPDLPDVPEVAVITADGRRIPVPGPDRPAVGSVTGLAVGDQIEAVSDVFAVDLATVDDGAWLRRGVARLDTTVVAALGTFATADTARLLADLTGRPVRVVAAEHHAAAVGAASTPALPPGAAVCDIGGGTVDVVDGAKAVVAAGAGELITLAVASALDVPRALAERVKRTAAVHVEAPHLAHEEDGRRTFLATQAPPAAIGRLCHRLDGELLPFSERLAAEEWRSLRLAVKRETVGVNISRCLTALGGTSAVLVLAGGGALDDELVRTVTDSLRGAVTVGRANVAGRFGPRYAVAWGLAQIASAGAEERT
ncbi:diol dehydratase reactivase ATPase-like domain-containing protein [Nakamurella endophytica]|uniref:Diol dehydratase reactivation protein n=1 Tax=Nakamurella endophytica TaxID=1748367 RepID=A0A917WHJ8_9ACTN|nr:diol dehydratase reactivase ATPase-like domain-containing protein [Nakamurella endophytica]GGM04635.1 diol dehydratase reactivation protein [Nakamurella endophytica]